MPRALSIQLDALGFEAPTHTLRDGQPLLLRSFSRLRRFKLVGSSGRWFRQLTRQPDGSLGELGLVPDEGLGRVVA